MDVIDDGDADADTEGPTHDDGNLDLTGPIAINEKHVAQARKVLGLAPRRQLVDRQDQSDAAAAEDWRTVDVPSCMRNLHDSDEVVVRRALQRLHINVKWPHGTPDKLPGIFQAAGAPVKALGYIPQIVQGCQVGHGKGLVILAASLTSQFNEEVQMDLVCFPQCVGVSPGRSSWYPCNTYDRWLCPMAGYCPTRRQRYQTFIKRH